MSLKIDRLQLEIIINNDQARKSLRLLEDEANNLTKEMKKLDKTSDEYRQKSARLSEIKTQMDSIYQSIGIANMTMRELTNRQKELNMILQHLRPGTAEYVKLKEELSAVGNRIAELRGKAKDTGLSIGKLADGFNRYFAIITAGAATLTGLIFSFRKVVDVFNEFEKKVDNLSALTGLAGNELDYLSDEAKKMSISMVEGNIRITQSADAIVDAYTKVGSARPELLKNKEDLAAVTREAMILAAAANTELQPAVDGLTMVLNQFNAPASESRRIINTLAAGSKEGAGEIPYLTAAIEKAGTIASDAGMSIEELVGVIETMAPRMKEPEMAGRNLRAIILKLQETADDTNPVVVGFSQAIENLAKKNLSATELTNLFGLENIAAARILMKNTEETKKYTNAVTGTNVALEQANINTDNNASKLAQARNKVQLLSIEFGEKLAPAMTFSTNTFAAFMRVALAAPDFFRRHQIAIIALTGALLAYNASLLKSTALKAIDFIWNRNLIAQYIRNSIVLNAMVTAEKLKTLWTTNSTVATKLATTAQYLWNAALAANPLGIVIVAITALVAAIKIYDATNADAIRLEKERAQVLSDLKKSNDILESTYDKQKEQLTEINKLSAENRQRLLDQVDATLNLAEAELALAEERKRNIEKETKPTAWQTFTNYLKGKAVSTQMSGLNMFGTLQDISQAENAKENTKDITDEIDKTRNLIKELRSTKQEINNILKAESIADAIDAKNIDQLEEKLRNYQVALKNANTDSEDFHRIQSKIKVVNEQIAKLNDADASGTDNKKDSLKTLGDAYSVLNEQIAEYTKGIHAAIVNGDIPQAEALKAKRKELEELLETYKKVEAAIEAGWDMDQRDLPNVEKLVSHLSGKPVPSSGESPLKKRNTGLTPGPSQDIIDYETNQKDKKEAINNAAIESASAINGAIFDIVRNRQQAEFDHKMSLLEKQREKELSNKNLTEEQKAAIHAKYDKKEKKLKAQQFKKQQNAAAIEALVNGALAVTKTYAQWGFPQGIPMAIAQGVATLAEIAVIKTAKAPEYGSGEYTVIGEKTGKSYTAPYIGKPKTGLYTRPAIFAESGGEIIIDPATTRNLQMNYPEVIRAINFARVPQFAAGNYTQTATGTPAFNQFQQPDPEMLKAMREFTEVMRQIHRDGIHGIWSLFDLEKIQDKKSDLESITSL